MNRFWYRHLQPIIETVRPSRIMEVGADRGWNTQHILEYCRQHDCHVDIIDPTPQPSLHEVMSRYGDEYTYHPLRSVEAIPLVATPDIALLDGDHNWTTIYNELTLIFAGAAEAGVKPPIILAHDCAWPYARRDMYYKPDDLDPTERHPYAYRGILPGVSELVEEGLNGVLANATHEGGPRNGVLTGIEDFIASSPHPIHDFILPFFNGLGIFVPESRMTPQLRALIDSFFTAEALLQACIAIENDSMHLRAVLQQTEGRLTRRTDALKRARELLAQQAALIETLQARIDTADTVLAS